MGIGLNWIEKLGMLDQGKLDGNVEWLIDAIKEDEKIFPVLIARIHERVNNRIELFNILAVGCYQYKQFDYVIPFLEEALKEDEFNKDALMNLGQILSEVGEQKLALSYVLKIRDKDQEVLSFINYLNESFENEDILEFEQNDVEFTGERLIINRHVKYQYPDVLEEHINRYKFACSHVKNKIVLDAACGAGYGSKMMSEAGATHVTGVDISEESLIHARKDYNSSNIKFSYGDVNKLPFKDSSFEVIVSFETIEHIRDGSHWIREATRLLKEDGLFLVSTPNRSITNPGTYFEEAPLNRHHCFEYNAIEFIGELTKEFDIVGIYGQSYVHDQNNASTTFLRTVRKLDINFKPTGKDSIHGADHDLIPLGLVKDMQPMYLVAVCRKKRK
ncbi:class I SAM-dependent methyltransferase [Paenibacillus sp. P96]|uniref:Class I SAM-dependent methyltransferase n=1 Tax=Paenibacillus zeirhizosphaerae TaxID=2987519 RepID=A0ABT9FV90_9BACL|nr:class I SAM-dependent methyltransferase [Paenibacillus sp. P96]MDP4098589.1 class I SAM-dependent methyltransferase [Paenibacillus sp. P96]